MVPLRSISWIFVFSSLSVVSVLAAPKNSGTQKKAQVFHLDDQATLARCEQYKKDIESLGGNSLGNLEDPFPSNTKTEEAYQIWAKFPGANEANHRTSEALIQYDAKELDWNFQKAKEQKGQPCSPIFAYNVFKKLIPSIKKYSWPKEKKEAFVKSTLSIVKKSLSRPTSLVWLLVNEAMIQRLNDEGWLNPSDKTKDALKEFRARSNEFKAKLSAKWKAFPDADFGKVESVDKIKPEHLKAWQDLMIMEARETDALRKEFLKVLGQLDNNSSPL